MDNTAEATVTGALYGDEAGRFVILAKTARFWRLSGSLCWVMRCTGRRADWRLGSSARGCFCGRSSRSSSSGSWRFHCWRRADSSRVRSFSIFTASNLSKWMFLPAFAGVGLRTQLRDLVNQGWRPIMVGVLGEIFIAAVTLGAWCSLRLIRQRGVAVRGYRRPTLAKSMKARCGSVWMSFTVTLSPTSRPSPPCMTRPSAGGVNVRT